MWICQTRSIQSGEKERADLSGRIAADMDVAKSDFSQMRRSDLGFIKNAEHFARIDLDRPRFEKERNQCECSLRLRQLTDL